VEDNIYLEGITDNSGKFSIKGLKAGRWDITVYLDKYGDLSLSEIEVSDDYIGVISTQLILPSGVINGLIYDDKTGLPFKKGDGREWWLRIINTKTDKCCSIIHQESGSRFVLKGIKEGEYYLKITAECSKVKFTDDIIQTEYDPITLKSYIDYEYEVYKTKPFYLKDPLNIP